MPQLCTFGAASGRGFGLTEETGGSSEDGQFNLTTLLLPGNGTNGAQNNTFLDSSASPLTLTRNGNPTQGTFSPFSFGSGTQADGYYSGYFDGSGDYISIPTSNVLMHQIGNWTYEGWIFWNVMPSTGYQNVFGQGAGGQNSFGLTVYNGSTWSAPYKFIVNQANIGDRITGTTTIVANMWYHFAVVRNSGVITLYVNGRAEGTYSNSTDYAFGGNPFTIGDNSNARISNFRFNRSAVYTSNFTVPTTPLTAIANTSLLTCQSSRFIDNSTNTFAITVNGNSQPVPTNPFGMTDWSGYFDGTGDYLNLTQSAFAVGTGNFTLEAWVFLTSAPGTEAGVISSFNTATGQGFYLGLNSSRQPFFAIGNGGVVNPTVTGAAIPLSTWVHLAGVRSSGTISLYVNGSSVGTPTSATASIDRTLLGIGLAYPNSPQGYITGCISNARVTSNAVYTSAFTPPTSPLTAITGTQLLTCQSSTFIDNSANAFAITVNGNAYTGTLNNPFDSPANYDIPALQYWSNYFDGTGDYLNGTNALAFAFGTGDFTIECWVYSTAGSNNGVWQIASSAFPGSAGLAVAANGGQWTVYYGSTSQAHGIGSIGTGAWQHVALVRQSGSLYLYSNGVKYTVAASDTTNYTYTALVIGGYYSTAYLWNGYISNFRVVKGTAVYTANFTVPTTPLTAIANTSLLTCQSNRFVDNSINQFAITRNGDTSVQAFSPFQPTEPYSTTSVGGSVYFDGSNSKLTTSANIDISGLFTIECWYNLTVAPGGWFFTIGNLPVYVDVTAGQITLDKSSVGVQLTTTANEQAKGTNCWKHLAITRDAGGVIRVFVNGIQVGSVTTSYSAGILNGLGAYANYGGNIAGYISNFRVIAGSALYTSNFVPPTAPLTAVSGTSLLVSAINGGITDATAKNVLETVGNAQISTAQSKFGGSSMYFDGTGDYLTLTGNPTNFAFGTGDFTIEMWLYANSVSNSVFYDGRPAGTNGAYPMLYFVSGVLLYWVSSADRITSGTAVLSTSTWYHIALCRSGTNTKLFLNGVQIGSTYTDSTNYLNTGNRPWIGVNASSTNTSYLNGYIDDLRITKGYARYTTNFTPPTSAFPLY